MTEPGLPRVGAPVVEPHLPLEGTAPARFRHWLEVREARVAGMLESLTDRWDLLASFVEVNFLHPEVGPAGALFMVSSRLDGRTMRRRAERLLVIPHSERAPYLPRWHRGESVAVAVADMPDPLARRYEATPIRWSLRVPVRVEGDWVGLVGAVTGDEGFSSRVIQGFEAMSELVSRDFAADCAWCRFRDSIGSGKRFLSLLR